MDYLEANDFSNFLKNNKINHQFIYGLMDEEKGKIINKFENEHCLLISTYDCLKEIYFNFINYTINKLNIIVAFKTPYIEKINNCLTKITSKNKKIELNGIIINNGVNQEDFLSNYYNIENEIDEYKKIIKIALYQNVLIKFLNSNVCKNIIKSYFLKISLTSFISDSINYFRYKWCEYYDKSKNKINIFDFLESINLSDLLFYINDFDKYIQNEFLDLMIIFNLFFQLNKIHSKYTITITEELKNNTNNNNPLILEGYNINENLIYANKIYPKNIEINDKVNENNEINIQSRDNKFVVEKSNYNNDNLNSNNSSVNNINIKINNFNIQNNYNNNNLNSNNKKENNYKFGKYSDTSNIITPIYTQPLNNDLKNNKININVSNNNKSINNYSINIENDKSSYINLTKKTMDNNNSYQDITNQKKYNENIISNKIMLNNLKSVEDINIVHSTKPSPVFHNLNNIQGNNKIYDEIEVDDININNNIQNKESFNNSISSNNHYRMNCLMDDSNIKQNSININLNDNNIDNSNDVKINSNNHYKMSCFMDDNNIKQNSININLDDNNINNSNDIKLDYNCSGNNDNININQKQNDESQNRLMTCVIEQSIKNNRIDDKIENDNNNNNMIEITNNINNNKKKNEPIKKTNNNINVKKNEIKVNNNIKKDDDKKGSDNRKKKRSKGKTCECESCMIF